MGRVLALCPELVEEKEGSLAAVKNSGASEAGCSKADSECMSLYLSKIRPARGARHEQP